MLILYGEYDWIMSRDDQELAADGEGAKFDEGLVNLMIEWLKGSLSKSARK